MPTNKLAKQALENIIRKSRVHLYKPIQIAEILYHHRTEKGWNLRDLESYRNLSKKWRDEISLRLVGRRSTSSQKFQDNIFETNAIPPNLLAALGKTNRKGKGFIEAYIYKALENRLSSVRTVEKYIKSSKADSFDLLDLVTLFKRVPGLRRSIDKMYEILVYALFATIVRALEAKVTLEIGNKDKEILNDFENFIKMVLGINKKQTKLVSKAALYRVGITNAADRGLDIWANFGPAIQVKHLTLTPIIVEDIIDNLAADKIIIVCLNAERKSIETLLKQVGWDEKIQGIITIDDLADWYTLCLSKKYKRDLGNNLLRNVEREFKIEFPTSTELKPFMSSRGYDTINLPRDWKIEI
jgi:type II restriction enzyme